MQPSKCPHCGAPAQIPPATQFFTCGYCSPHPAPIFSPKPAATRT